MEKEYIIIYTVKMKYAYHTKWYDKWYPGGANHPHYSVIRAPHSHLSLHLVWYAYFNSVG